MAQDEFMLVAGLAGRRRADLLVDAVLPARNFAYRQLSLQHFSIAELAAAKVLRFSALAWEGKARAVRIADDRKARSTYQSIVLRAS